MKHINFYKLVIIVVIIFFVMSSLSPAQIISKQKKTDFNDDFVIKQKDTFSGHLVFIEPGPTQKSTLYADDSEIELQTRIVSRLICGSNSKDITIDDLKEMTLPARQAFQSELSTTVSGGGSQSSRSTLNIVFNPTPSVPGGALTALNACEAYLESVFDDPITVTISVDFDDLPSGVLGWTSSASGGSPSWTNTRNGLINDMDPDDYIQNWLPSGSTIPVRYDGTSSSVTNENECFFNKANYRAAIGSVSGTDGWVTFNTDFTWDYTPPSISGHCFQSVMIHEVGHALGFTSNADGTSSNIEALDIFRFQRTDGTGDYNPDTVAEFQTTARLVDYNTPNDDHNSNLFEPGGTDVEYRMSDGDPYQASHFRQGYVNAIMQPAIGSGTTFYPDFYRDADINMFDAIGWDYAPEPGTTTIPFFDDFPSTTIDPLKWTGIEGAEINTLGINEPSASYSLNLDGSSDGGDKIRTAKMDTSTLTEVLLEYYYERTGSGNSPEPGDDLVVEYYNSNANWIEVARYPGSGSDMSTYTFSSRLITATDAFHTNFRVQFSVESYESGQDDWFIDDVSIWADTMPPEPNPMTWEIPPTPISSSELTMTATNATDDSPPVQYFFFCWEAGTGGANSSGWQESNSYIDDGLDVNSVYTYNVATRDSANPRNYGLYSSPTSTATHIEAPTGLTFGTITTDSIEVSATGTFTNLNIGQSGLFLEMIPAEGNGANTWVQTPTITVTGLNPGTQYCFRAKARNRNLIETAFTNQDCVQTTSPLFTLDGECTYQNATSVDPLIVNIINLNTEERWDVGTVANYYSLDLAVGIDISVDDVLRIIAKDGERWINVTDHIVTQSEINNGGTTENLILDEYYLDLTDFPMYQAEDIAGYTFNQMTGAAVAQMNLDYMWWNISNDILPPTWSSNNGWNQSNLYNYGQENNSNISLPYMDATGIWHTIQTLDPEPYSEYGYNFGIYNNIDSDIMLAQICQWIDYPAGTKPGHPKHVPGAVPTFGNYSRWMSVRGIHMNQTAYPLPGALDVYGFWVNDPYPSGIGENTYKTSADWTSYYYQPISVTDDPYVGEYVAICEPPLPDEECDLTLVPSPERWEPLDEQPPGQRKDGMSAFFLRQVTDNAVVKAAIDGVTDQLIPYDPDFEDVFRQTYPGRPILVKNLVEEKGDYYAVSFNNVATWAPIPRDGHSIDEDITLIVVLVDANDGHFKEASWVNEPVRYLPISRIDALEIVYDKLGEMGINPGDLNVREIKTDIVYRNLSPLNPDWRVIISELGLTLFVDQDGKIVT